MLTTKIVHFVKLSKCETDITIVFLLSRLSKKYMERPIQSTDEGVMSQEDALLLAVPTQVGSFDSRKFQQLLKLSESLEKPARVPGVIPTSGILTNVGSSDYRNFRQT